MWGSDQFAPQVGGDSSRESGSWLEGPLPAGRRDGLARQGCWKPVGTGNGTARCSGGAELCPPLCQPALPELCPPQTAPPAHGSLPPRFSDIKKERGKIVSPLDQNLGFRRLIPHAFVEGVRNHRAGGKISPLYSPTYLQYWTSRKKRQQAGEETQSLRGT